MKRNNLNLIYFLFVVYLMCVSSENNQNNQKSNENYEDNEDIDIKEYSLKEKYNKQHKLSLWSHVQRYLMSSNCITIERGRVPPYARCLGCEIERAMNCLNDLRRNLSGNVHPSCHIGGLNEAYDTSCCPQYIVKRKRTILKYETSAYPSALSCLRNVGCETSHVYTDLLDECMAVCKNNVQNTIYFTCTALGNSSSSTKLSIIFLIFCFFLSIFYIEYF